MKPVGKVSAHACLTYSARNELKEITKKLFLPPDGRPAQPPARTDRSRLPLKESRDGGSSCRRGAAAQSPADRGRPLRLRACSGKCYETV